MQTMNMPLLAQLQQTDAPLTIGGLWGSAKAYLTALLQQAHAGAGLIITPSAKRAEEVYEDMLFFQQIGLVPYPRAQIHLYSAWNIAPYEPASPHRDIVSERLAVLDKLSSHERILIIAPLEALIHRILPRAELSAYTLYLAVGETVERQQFIASLVDTGYKHVYLVENRGEFSVRGGIVDIFPSLLETPLRIEFFGDDIESLREFDPATQRSIRPLELVNLLPGREVILTARTRAAALASINQRVAAVGASLNALKTLTGDVQAQVYFPGLEWYAPDFHGPLETLFDYLAPDTLIVLDEPDEMHATLPQFDALIQKSYHAAEEKGFPLPLPESLFLTPDGFAAHIQTRRQIRLHELQQPEHDAAGTTVNVATKAVEWAYTLAPDGQGSELADQHIMSSATRLKEWLDDHYQIVIAAYTEYQAKRLAEILQDHAITAHIWTPSPEAKTLPLNAGTSAVHVVVGMLNGGFVFTPHRLIVLNEDDFLGKRTVRRRHLQRRPVDTPAMTLGELELHDYVVHIDHGIGVYLGLKKVTVQNITMECLHLEYSGGDKLYVPVDRLDLVQKYQGADQRAPKMDKLGGTSWARVKARVKESVEQMAQELLHAYAARQALPGVQYAVDEHLYREFEASFEYEETPDQKRAIEDVIRDMLSPKPMDRLVCGDVGYGKTEVAMRAAFRAILNGKQVAVLVPTTILAQQHAQTFQRRFGSFPVQIGVLSRFKSKKEQQAVVQGLQAGTVDLVIGTHRLLQKDIAFKDLGLVIIDEEQRFGVAHKEKIRQYRQLVDVLTLTATPIPRTLHMSLMGVRDLSIIESPPEGRLSVRTYVMRFDDDVIYEALTRELERGGQVFVVHNDIETIDGLALRISRMLPHVRLAIGHGQMKEHHLEDIMFRFMNKELDVLISTTIIESGLDIPSVNTMIINQAHKFGLAQLYQLRGRIGRSKERAYAYLLIPSEQLLTPDAKKRLRAIQEMTELGSGFKLAAHDLEIRGAGSLLGAEQSGQIAALGFDMYCDVIEQTVRELKGQPQPEEFYPQIDLRVSAHLPEEFIPDMKQRLDVYKRLMSAQDFAKIADIAAEMRDRFGKLPVEAENIVLLAEMKLLATQMRVQQIQAVDGAVNLMFDARSSVSEERLKQAAKQSHKTLRLTSTHSLAVETPRLKNADKINRIKQVLQALR